MFTCHFKMQSTYLKYIDASKSHKLCGIWNVQSDRTSSEEFKHNPFPTTLCLKKCGLTARSISHKVCGIWTHLYIIITCILILSYFYKITIIYLFQGCVCSFFRLEFGFMVRGFISCNTIFYISGVGGLMVWCFRTIDICRSIFRIPKTFNRTSRTH